MRSRLDSLTALRGPAALLVFAYHILHDTTWVRSGWIASIGFAGVGLFYVLSGFVLTWSFRGGSWRAFYVRRIARVYPLHLLFLAVAVVVPATPLPRRPEAFIPNLLLVQAWIPDWGYIFSFNAVSWSLACEMFFYACTPLVLSRLDGHRRAEAALLAWFLATVVVASVVSLQSHSVDVSVYANPLARSGEFTLGMAAALRLRRRSAHHLRPWAPHAAIGAALAMLVVMHLLRGHALNQSMTGFCLAPFFALVVYTLARAEQSRPGRGGPAWLSMLTYAGEISFAFYLTHELVIVNLRRGGLDAQGGPKGLALAGVALVVSVLVASLAHHVVEKPAQRWLTRAAS